MHKLPLILAISIAAAGCAGGSPMATETKSPAQNVEERPIIIATGATREEGRTQRLLIISFMEDARSTAEEQVALFRALETETVERDLVVEAHSVKTVRGGSFQVELIGKDGGVKLLKNEIVRPKDVFDLIDSMPMRQAEMRRQTTGS